MKLSFNQIKDITLGAVRITQEEDGFHFYRFTAEQEEIYKARSDKFYKKTFSTSGIQLSFKTDSSSLFIKTVVFPCGSRQYFAFDIFVNGVKIDTVNNFSGVVLPDDYTELTFPMGEFEKEIPLGIGEKEVCVYFPWSVTAVIRELALDENAAIQPIRPSKKMLCFGDSITQGYDALYPSNQYASQFAKLLGAEAYNKAIGGEIFCPELASARDDFEPDYITVAYGTNDWDLCTEEAFCNNCKGFFENLGTNYPNSRIYAITPIWRKDYEECISFGGFDRVAEIIENIAESYDNVIVIPGFHLVGHDERLFGDLCLHPNDAGFAQYFRNLAKAIEV